MNLIFLGAPGAGKGTQAKLIMRKFNIPQISTGDILREAVQNGTCLGKKAQEYMNKGLLVPDEIVIGLMQEKLNDSSCKHGFILDGFPRTILQAESLDQGLQIFDKKLDKVINFSVNEELLIERLSGRRVCTKCGQMYNIYFNPPTQENLCNQCGSSLFQRKDDNIETIKERLIVYQSQTSPLIDYYLKKNLLHSIDANNDQNEIFNNLIKILGNV